MEIKVPNIGGVSDVDVIEILVSPGDKVKKDTSLITLESDKASMEIPSPEEGEVEKLQVKVGDKVSEGSLILTLKTLNGQQTSKEASADTKVKGEVKADKSVEQKKPKTSEKASTEMKVTIPDIGDAKNVEVIEILVHKGDQVKKEDSLITLEGEKATIEIPSPYSGEVKTISLKVGDKVSKGNEILTLITQESEEPTSVETKEEASKEALVPSSPPVKEATTPSSLPVMESGDNIHAGPAVRRMAREFGIALQEIKGSGPKGRVVTEDLQKYVKTALAESSAGGAGLRVEKMPDIDFSKFGAIEKVALSKIKKLTGINVHRSWVTIPHVTQFGQADITDMDEFRKAKKVELEKQGIKLTPLVFIMKAVVAALKAYPHFNASLDSSGENLILKKYVNLGIAVDTPNGLVVPVVKDVDQKGMIELASELANLSEKARKKGLTPGDMAGSCFTISSLGGIGGTAFTPIINAPDVAILGVSKAAITPIYEKGQFVPRLMLPLSLSYDHRVIDGADGARFLVFLASCLSDIRTLLL